MAADSNSSEWCRTRVRALEIGARAVAGFEARLLNSFRAGFDLQTLFNNLASHPLFYRSELTLAFERIESSFNPQWSPCHVGMFFSMLYNFPTQKLPRHFNDCRTQPTHLLIDQQFERYRVK